MELIDTSPRVLQVGIADGGVPKRAIAVARIGAPGIEGDRQDDVRNHGGPDRAVCLYFLECILELQQEGHTVFPGAVGENITTVGLEPSLVVPGARLAIGGQVVLEVTSYTIPCRTIAPFFRDGDPTRISQDLFPGWSRVYARVLHEGTITPGDAITLLGQSSR